jgi:hypothetical protein
VKTHLTGLPCKNGHISERYVNGNGCLECLKNRYQKNRDKMLGYQKEWYQKNKDSQSLYQSNRIKQRIGCKSSENKLYYAAKFRAKQKGLDFNLEKSDIIIPQYCPVFTDLELDKKNSGNSKSNSPTLDRIDNNKGYVKGNVKVISHRANSLKSSGTILEFTKIIEYIESGLQEKF